jgi:multidrug resistance protein MdtO
MEDIGQLSLLIFAVSALGGWIATGSELISYAGMQLAFAFDLGVLQDYGPSTDLTALRDRVAGIVLGNVVMSVVFSVLWPVGAVDRARTSVATALRTLGQLLADETRAKAGTRLAVIRALGEARRYIGLAAFELRLLPASALQDAAGGVPLNDLDRLAGATFAVVDQPEAPGVPEDLRRQDRAMSAWLIASADRLAKAAGTVAADTSSGLDRAWATLPGDAPTVLRAAVEARALLQSEIDNAVAART